MKATTTLMFALLAMTTLTIDSASADQWRGNINISAVQQIGNGKAIATTNDVSTTINGWAGGQVGTVLGLGDHVVTDNTLIDGVATLIDASGDLLYVTYTANIAFPIDGKYFLNGTLKVNGGSGRFAKADGQAGMTGTIDGDMQNFAIEFSGQLVLDGNFNMAGMVEFADLRTGHGASVAYTMFNESGVLDVTSQTGTLQPTTTPEFDESDTEILTVTFFATSGLNETLGRPMHQIKTADGDLYANLEAHVRIEIDRLTGDAVQKLDGLFTILGGTGIYENATGQWHALMETEPSTGDGPVLGIFEFSGDIQLETIDNGIRDQVSTVTKVLTK